VADIDAWIVWQLRVRQPRPHGRRGVDDRPAVSAVASWYAYLIVAAADDPVLRVTRNPAEHAARPRVDPRRQRHGQAVPS
jgi:hypothetical protein